MSSHNNPPAPLLEMRGIEKSFPGVRALDGVDLSLHSGEVHAVVGENGAGKSTLIKVLSGVHRPDGGSIAIGGTKFSFDDPVDAQDAGIGVIYQEFNLVPELTVRENVLLGHEKSTFGFPDKKAERKQIADFFDKIGIDIDPDASCGSLRVAQQQLVEIAKALSLGAKILVMDEPSASLTNREVERLFAIVRDLQSQGIGIIYISHRLEEIFEIADRVTVLRDGQYIGTHDVAEMTREKLIEEMVGRSLENEFPSRTSTPGEVRLVVKNMTRLPAVRDVSLSVRAGEILGITGLVGAGRTELARLIFGADQEETGQVLLDGQALSIRNPADAIRHGICLLTEDRKGQGLILGLTARENFSLPNLESWTRRGIVNGSREREAFAAQIEKLRVRVSHQDQIVKNLSGGNQQKVLIARWLEANTEVVIFDEPTRGIDVGAKYEIYVLMNELATLGKVVIMISSELPEVLGMSDRIVVMCEGQVSGEIDNVADASQEMIMEMAVRQIHSAETV